MKFFFYAALWPHLRRAPVAQLDRASDFGSEGRRFEPCWVHHLFAPVIQANKYMSQSPTEQHRKLAIIGIRYDENSSFTKGAADAPPQIRAALRSDAWNLTSENGTD